MHRYQHPIRPTGNIHDIRPFHSQGSGNSARSPTFQRDIPAFSTKPSTHLKQPAVVSSKHISTLFPESTHDTKRRTTSNISPSHRTRHQQASFSSRPKQGDEEPDYFFPTGYNTDYTHLTPKDHTDESQHTVDTLKNFMNLHNTGGVHRSEQLESLSELTQDIISNRQLYDREFDDEQPTSSGQTIAKAFDDLSSEKFLEKIGAQDPTQTLRSFQNYDKARQRFVKGVQQSEQHPEQSDGEDETSKILSNDPLIYYYADSENEYFIPPGTSLTQLKEYNLPASEQIKYVRQQLAQGLGANYSDINIKQLNTLLLFENLKRQEQGLEPIDFPDVRPTSFDDIDTTGMSPEDVADLQEYYQHQEHIRHRQELKRLKDDARYRAEDPDWHDTENEWELTDNEQNLRVKSKTKPSAGSDSDIPLDQQAYEEWQDGTKAYQSEKNSKKIRIVREAQYPVDTPTVKALRTFSRTVPFDEPLPKELQRRINLLLTDANYVKRRDLHFMMNDMEIWYIANRLPVVFSVIKRICIELRQRVPGFKPESVLEFAAGSCPALWAARDVFYHDLARYTSIERDGRLALLGQQLTADLGVHIFYRSRLLVAEDGRVAEDPLRSKRFAHLRYKERKKIEKDMKERAERNRELLEQKHNLIIVPYALSKQPNREYRQLLLDALWDQVDPNGGMLLLIESTEADSSGFNIIRESRDYLLKRYPKTPLGTTPGEVEPLVTVESKIDDEIDPTAPEWAHGAKANKLKDRSQQDALPGATAILPCSHDKPCPMKSVLRLHQEVQKLKKIAHEEQLNVSFPQVPIKACMFGQRMLRGPMPNQSPIQDVQVPGHLGDAVVENFSYVVLRRGNPLPVTEEDLTPQEYVGHKPPTVNPPGGLTHEDIRELKGNLADDGTDVFSGKNLNRQLALRNLQTGSDGETGILLHEDDSNTIDDIDARRLAMGIFGATSIDNEEMVERQTERLQSTVTKTNPHVKKNKYDAINEQVMKEMEQEDSTTNNNKNSDEPLQPERDILEDYDIAKIEEEIGYKLDAEGLQSLREAIMDMDKLKPAINPKKEFNMNRWSRVISPPLKRGRHVVLDLCTPDGNFERRVVGRQGVGAKGYTQARHTKWGDVWPYKRPISLKELKQEHAYNVLSDRLQVNTSVEAVQRLNELRQLFRPSLDKEQLLSMNKFKSKIDHIKQQFDREDQDDDIMPATGKDIASRLDMLREGSDQLQTLKQRSPIREVSDTELDHDDSAAEDSLSEFEGHLINRDGNIELPKDMTTTLSDTRRNVDDLITNVEQHVKDLRTERKRRAQRAKRLEKKQRLQQLNEDAQDVTPSDGAEPSMEDQFQKLMMANVEIDDSFRTYNQQMGDDSIDEPSFLRSPDDNDDHGQTDSSQDPLRKTPRLSKQESSGDVDDDGDSDDDFTDSDDGSGNDGYDIDLIDRLTQLTNQRKKEEQQQQQETSSPRGAVQSSSGSTKQQKNIKIDFSTANQWQTSLQTPKPQIAPTRKRRDLLAQQLEYQKQATSQADIHQAVKAQLLDIITQGDEDKDAKLLLKDQRIKGKTADHKHYQRRNRGVDYDVEGASDDDSVDSEDERSPFAMPSSQTDSKIVRGGALDSVDKTYRIVSTRERLSHGMRMTGKRTFDESKHFVQYQQNSDDDNDGSDDGQSVISTDRLQDPQYRANVVDILEHEERYQHRNAKSSYNNNNNNNNQHYNNSRDNQRDIMSFRKNSSSKFNRHKNRSKPSGQQRRSFSIQSFHGNTFSSPFSAGLRTPSLATMVSQRAYQSIPDNGMVTMDNSAPKHNRLNAKANPYLDYLPKPTSRRRDPIQELLDDNHERLTRTHDPNDARFMQHRNPLDSGEVGGSHDERLPPRETQHDALEGIFKRDKSVTKSFTDIQKDLLKDPKKMEFETYANDLFLYQADQSTKRVDENGNVVMGRIGKSTPNVDIQGYRQQDNEWQRKQKAREKRQSFGRRIEVGRERLARTKGEQYNPRIDYEKSSNFAKDITHLDVLGRSSSARENLPRQEQHSLENDIAKVKELRYKRQKKLYLPLQFDERDEDGNKIQRHKIEPSPWAKTMTEKRASMAVIEQPDEAEGRIAHEQDGLDFSHTALLTNQDGFGPKMDPVTGKLPEKTIITPFNYDMVTVSDIESLYDYAVDKDQKQELKTLLDEARVLGRNGKPLKLRLERSTPDKRQSETTATTQKKFKYSIEAMKDQELALIEAETASTIDLRNDVKNVIQTRQPPSQFTTLAQRFAALAKKKEDRELLQGGDDGFQPLPVPTMQDAWSVKNRTPDRIIQGRDARNTFNDASLKYDRVMAQFQEAELLDKLAGHSMKIPKQMQYDPEEDARYEERQRRIQALKRRGDHKQSAELELEELRDILEFERSLQSVIEQNYSAPRKQLQQNIRTMAQEDGITQHDFEAGIRRGMLDTPNRERHGFSSFADKESFGKEQLAKQRKLAEKQRKALNIQPDPQDQIYDFMPRGKTRM